jgi:hypothetical protein
MTLIENLNSELYFIQLYKELKHLTPFQPYSYSPGLNQSFYGQFEFKAIADKNKNAAVVFSNFPNDLQRTASNINEHFKASLIQAFEICSSLKIKQINWSKNI